MSRNVNIQAKTAAARAGITEPKVTALIGTLEKQRWFYVALVLVTGIQVVFAVLAIVGITCNIEAVIAPKTGLILSVASLILTILGFWLGIKAFKAVASIFKDY